MKSTEDVKRELFRRRDEYEAGKRKRSNAITAIGTALAAVFVLSAVIVVPGLLRRPGGNPATTGGGDGTKFVKETDPADTHSFIACVTEFGSGRSAVVRCTDGLDSVVSAGTEVSVQLDYDGAGINDMVRVTYTGDVMETYPIKLTTVRVEYIGKRGNAISADEVQRLLDEYKGKTVFNPVSLGEYVFYSSLTPEYSYGMIGGETVGGSVVIPERFREMLEDDADPAKHEGKLYAVLISSGIGGFGSSLNDDCTVGGKTVGEWRERYAAAPREPFDYGKITVTDKEALSMLKKADYDILDAVISALPRYYIDYSLFEKPIGNSLFDRMDHSVLALMTYDELMAFCRAEYEYPVNLIPAPSDGIGRLGFESHVGAE